jgi:hypothetical protein
MHTSVLCQPPLPGVAKNNCIAYNQKYHVAQIGTRSPVSQNAHRMQTFSTLFTMHSPLLWFGGSGPQGFGDRDFKGRGLDACGSDACPRVSMIFGI